MLSYADIVRYNSDQKVNAHRNTHVVSEQFAYPITPQRPQHLLEPGLPELIRSSSGQIVSSVQQNSSMRKSSSFVILKAATNSEEPLQATRKDKKKKLVVD